MATSTLQFQTAKKIKALQHIVNKRGHISTVKHVESIGDQKFRLLRLRDALFLPVPKTSAVKLNSKYELLRDLSLLIPGRLAANSRWPFGSLDRTLKALQSHQVKATKEDKLRIFNAIIHRCETLSVSVPTILMHYGLRIAAISNSSNSMHAYLQLIGYRFTQEIFQQDITLMEWASIANSILVANKGVQYGGWKGKRLKEAWTQVITGWSADNIGEGVREPCLYHAFSPYGINGLVHYFRLVKRFCPSETVLQSWLDTRHQHEKGGTLNSDLVNFIFNSSIQILITKNDPKRAWQIASVPGSGKISDQTWRMLFRHPECLQAWISDFDRPVMAALERYAKDAERQLGVTWTGGDNGVHEAKTEGLQLI